ncbi:MAG: dihydrofolate reductase [Alphaproteobacteria bacterium]
MALIAAVAENGVIGRGAAIPWRLSTDLRRFRALTIGKPLVMGRKTFETLPGPLPQRPNIVVGRQAGGHSQTGALIRASLADALVLASEMAQESGASEIMVIGGGAIYAAAIARAERLYITHVALAPQGDIVFPPIDPRVWRVVEEEHVPAGERDEVASRFVIYERDNAQQG